MNAVIDPEPCAPVRDQSQFAQMGEMARDMRLSRPGRMGQLADTKLFVLYEQYEATQARIVRQSGKEISRVHVHSS